MSDTTRIQYLNETACENGPSGNNYTKYTWCRTGYYAADPLNWSEWYNSCKACTNKPANSYYTSYSTPSTMYAVESNCPWSCDANYYKDGSSCTACNVSFTDTASCTYTSSITGGTKNYSSGTKSRTCYHQTSSAGSTSSSQCSGTQSCGSYGSCGSGTHTSTTCNAGYYKNSSNTCSACEAGYYCPGGTWDVSSSIAGRSSCSNKPSNSSYTGSATSNSCPWSCNANYYKDGSSCTACNVSFTDTASCTYTSSITGGTKNYSSGTKSRTCYHQTSSAGSTSSSACTGTQSCGSYGSCGGGTHVSTTCSAGYYKNTSNTCTQCEPGYYCPGGTYNVSSSVAGRESCPDPSTHKPTSFPSSYYNSPTVTGISISGMGYGASAATQCVALMWVDTDRAWGYEYTKYNGSVYPANNPTWASVKAGYYLTDKASCGSYAYYATVKSCPEGYYCPGKAYVECYAGNQSSVWTTNFGLESCPSNYPNSTAGSGSINSCYLSTTAGSYVATAGSGQTTCAAGGYCPGGSKVYYNGTGGRTECPSGYPSSDAGVSAVTSCYTTKTASCTKNNAGIPTNCYSVTAYNDCSCTGSTYRQYSNSAGNGNGTTSGTTSESCTKTPKTVTAKSGYRVDGVTCPACPTAYPNSANGNSGGYTACYTTKTASCTQNNGSTPTNCYSVTAWNSCSCTGSTYTQYANSAGTGNGSTSGTTSESCTKTPQTVTAKSGYRVDGVTCPACPTAYPNSANGNSGGASVCYTNCAAGTRVVSVNAACTTPAGGWYTGAHSVNYGQISPVNYCMSGFSSSGTSASNHDASTDCTQSLSGKAIAANTISARYIKVTTTGSTANGGSHVVEIQAFAARDGSGTNLLSGKTGPSGSNMSAATDGSWYRENYASGTMVWDMGAAKTIGSIKFALYTDGRTYHNVNVYVSTDNSNWTTVFTAADLLTQNSSTAKPEMIVLSAAPTNCSAGTYKAAYTATLGTTYSCSGCGDGQYQNESGKTSCKACSALGGGLYTKSDGSRNADTTCYISTTAGKYLAAKTDTSQTTCTATNYCPSENVYYPNVNTPKACPPADSTTARTTFPDSYLASENLQRTSFSQQSWTTGITSKDGCVAFYSFSNNRGNFSVESVRYNSTTGKYDTGGSAQYYTKVNPGYYLSVPYSSTYCNTSTNRMLYQSALPCPTGSYCPGYTSVPLCNSGLTYGDDIGITGCPSNYSNSAAKSDDINDCYLTTSSGKYVATAGAGQTTCACGGYCSGGTTVYYNGTGGWTGCGAGKYNSSTGSSASSACSTAAAGYVANSSCSATACTGATYQDEAGKTTCKSCPTSSDTDIQSYSYWNTGGDGDHTVREGCYANFKSKTLDHGSIGGYHCYIDANTDTYGATATGKTCWFNNNGDSLKCAGGYYNTSNATSQPGYATKSALLSGVCTAVGDGYYSGTDSLTRTQCPAADSGWTAHTTSTTSTAYSACYESKSGTSISTYCASGELRRSASSVSAYSTTVTIATALSAKAGSIVSGQTCSQCSAGYYSAGGTATSCSNCASANGANGRPQYSGAGASSCTECPAVTGTYASRATGSYAYYPAVHNNGANGCYAYFTDSDSNATFSTICYYNSTDGTYGGANSSCQIYAPSACAAGYYSTISSRSEWNSAGYAGCKGVDCMKDKVCTAVGTGYYSPADATTQTACSSLGAFYTSSDSGRGASTTCYGTTTAGNYLKTAKDATQSTCATGGYCPGGSKVYYGSAGGRTPCSAGYYNGSTGSSASSACSVCAAGTYSSSGASSCSNVTAGYYNTGCGTNATGSVCNTTNYSGGTIAAGYYGAAGATSSTGSGKVSAGYYSSGGGTSATPTAAGNGCISSKSCGGCSGRNSYSGAGASSCSAPGDGYYTTGCTGTDKCTGRSKCTSGNYCKSGVSTACTTTSGWTTASADGSSAYTACYQTRVPSNCNAGNTKRTASSISGTTITYGSETVDVPLGAAAGYYVNSLVCSACGGNNYYCAGGTAARKTVDTGYYSTGGTETTRSGQSQCTAGYYCSSGVRAECAGGKYSSSAGATSCSNITAGYYCAGGSKTATPSSTSDSVSGKSCGGCSGRNSYSGAGASSCSAPGDGYYTTGCTGTDKCTGRSKCTSGNYCKSGVSTACTTTSGWTTASADGSSAYTACYQTRVPSNCNAGNTKRTASSISGTTITYGSETVDVPLGAAAGYYVNSLVCSACGGNNYYCAGGTAARKTVDTGYYSTGGTETTRSGQSQCTAGYYCSSGVRAECAGGKYSSSAGATSCSNITAGYYCAGGSKTATPSSTSDSVSGKSCGGCSGRNSYSGAGASSCSAPGDGYYTTGCTGTDKCTGRSQCTSGNYCKNGISTACTTTSGWTTASADGSSAYTACYQTQTPANCSSGTIKRTASSISGTTITYGSASVTSALGAKAGYYVNSTACSACGGNNYYCAGGTAERKTVSSGYYSTGGDANTRTGQSQCSGFVYCASGVKYDCPAVADHKQTTFSDDYYGGCSITSTNASSKTGLTAITQCEAQNWLSCTRGKMNEHVMYNSTSQKYDTYVWHKWTDAHAGYYLTGKDTCGSYAYYSDAKICEAGSYCPGKAKVDCDSSNAATVHTTNFGLNACPSSYPNSGAGSTAITSCYSGTKSRAWSGSQTSCSAPTGCSSATCNSCSKAACDYVAYSNANGNGDGSIKSGCSTNNASCQQTVKSVTAKANYYATLGGGAYTPLEYIESTGTQHIDTGYNLDTNNLTIKTRIKETESTSSEADICGNQDNTTNRFVSGLYQNGAFAYNRSSDDSNANATISFVRTNDNEIEFVYDGNNQTKYIIVNGAKGSEALFSANIYPSNSTIQIFQAGSDRYHIKCQMKYLQLIVDSTLVRNFIPAKRNSDGAVGMYDTVTDKFYGNSGSGSFIAGPVSSNYLTCSACPSSYPNSGAGSTAITSCYSNTKSRAWTGSQTSCSAPTGCSSATCNSCSIAACNYVAYSNANGNGDGTIKDGCSTNNASCQQTVKTVTAKAGYYAGSTATSCTACPTAYPNSGAGSTDINSCYLSTTAGSYVATAGAGQTTCVAGNYCAGGTTVYYNKTGGIAACACGTYQPATGQASCKKTDGGYYATGTGNTDQTAAGAGNWASAGACGATACATGLTTIGYGAGADEEADCGRKLHVGDEVMYLRSVKKTTPSFNVDINNDGKPDFFGNMSTVSKTMSDKSSKSYKTIYNGSTYYIYDDSKQ
ncbi:MAG: hypothetical protein MJ170_03160 [Alphaproteobacteria bacterium]|nr:hypothetical protein [Alphaproteobacteria bacterium]